MFGFWTSNCSQTFNTPWIDLKILAQYSNFKGNIKRQFHIYWKQASYEGDISPQSFSLQMQFGKLKLDLWTSIGFWEICTSWIDLKILPHKLEEKAQISKQVLLNLDIGCKSYETLNWTWNYVMTLLVPFGDEGLRIKLSKFCTIDDQKTFQIHSK